MVRSCTMGNVSCREAGINGHDIRRDLLNEAARALLEFTVEINYLLVIKITVVPSAIQTT